MTSNVWIEHTFRDIPNFYGVFSSDGIVPPFFYPSCCIVNFSREVEEGTHYVLLLYDHENTCTYFDPMDLDFIPEDISTYMSTRFGKNISYIHYSIQNIFSNYCAIYCMFACMLQFYNVPIKKHLKHISRSLYLEMMRRYWFFCAAY